MSASRSPTLAPESWREAARLTAMVDLPTPPFPEPTAITCFTPGTILSREPRLNAARTLEVIFRSTADTPGRLPTRSGSRIADSAVRTSSLLGTENHRRSHREDTEQDQD